MCLVAVVVCGVSVGSNVKDVECSIVVCLVMSIVDFIVEHNIPALFSSLLRQLHWLSIEQRIKYKTACLCYQLITGTAP